VRVVPEIGEYYHVYNRGVDKRDIFFDADDLDRFMLSIEFFNVKEPIGSIYERGFSPDMQDEAIVDVVAYCLNPNHYHLLLFQRTERGIQKFMQRLATGYTMYFNEKYERAGALFQGRYKAVHITSNEQLLHTSVYVNLNNQLGGSTSKFSRSSWDEYRSGRTGLCSKDIILRQFSDLEKYEKFALDSGQDILRRKQAELTLLGG
jgi:putative transposase